MNDDDDESNGEYLSEFKKNVAEYVSITTHIDNDCVILQKLIGNEISTKFLPSKNFN